MLQILHLWGMKHGVEQYRTECQNLSSCAVVFLYLLAICWRRIQVGGGSIRCYCYAVVRCSAMSFHSKSEQARVRDPQPQDALPSWLISQRLRATPLPGRRG